MKYINQFIISMTLFLGLMSSATAATQVEFETSAGNFVVEVYPDKAPKTVENFLRYVNDGFYNNTIFHRVISRFMIQGGGFERDLTEKPTRAPIANESDNGLLNQTGTIAMARTSDPNSATAQFFVNLADNQFLNYTSPEPDYIGYCVFGKVVSGMDVVHKIGIVPTGNNRGFSDVPIKAIVIKQAKVKSPVAAK
ncbi:MULTISPECIES: peptidylprolyl isomerase [unclassified Methylotenera]|jgi:cyclophilin family peptidyl-prolyl cis-trans isomerase|uniref:peptidylprolyl isomerase n=1 Tax=unclassified Methylotenera TaxID=2643294 RepID=UPI0003708820|nr:MULTISPECIES: peptidylprolyl isomerase [unclassified Methylotenera]